MVMLEGMVVVTVVFLVMVMMRVMVKGMVVVTSVLTITENVKLFPKNTRRPTTIHTSPSHHSLRS